MTPEGAARRQFSILDGGTARTMRLHRETGLLGRDGGTDSWASTAHGASIYLAERMEHDHLHAWGFAKGRERRLRDGTVSGTYARYTGQTPIVRVVCTSTLR